MKFLASLILLVFYSNSAISYDRKTSFSEKPNCEKQGGVWRQFGDSCVNSCESKLDQFSVCAQAITYGCDCLKNKCSDNGKCVSMDDYKIKHDEIVAARKEILDKQKEERKDEFLANRQAILQKMISPAPEVDDKKNNKPNTNNQNQNNPNNNYYVAPNNNQPSYIVNDPNVAKSPNYIDNSPPINLILQPVKTQTNDNFQVPPFFSKAQEQAVKKVEEEEKAKLEEQQKKDNGLSLPQVPIN